MQRGVEGGVLDAQLAVGGCSQPGEDGVAVHSSPREGFEDEHVERALKNVDFLARHCVSTKRLGGGWSASTKLSRGVAASSRHGSGTRCRGRRVNSGTVAEWLRDWRCARPRAQNRRIPFQEADCG